MDEAKGNDRLFGLTLTLFGLLAFVLAVVFLLGYGWPGRGIGDYPRFVIREPAYHAQFAQACEALLRSTPQGHHRHLAGSDAALDPVILQLHPRIVNVARDIIVQNQTNQASGVTIYVGIGPAMYSVVWAPQDGVAENPVWELSANQESLSTVLFKTNFSAAVNRR
jgi:hypothetical protein